MASIAQPRVQAPALPRPRVEESGLWSWLTTVDHKRIAKLYGVSAFIFFLLGGLEAMLIRAQLTRPENNIVKIPAAPGLGLQPNFEKLKESRLAE